MKPRWRLKERRRDKMEIKREEIKKLLGKKRWCKQCQRAEDFISRQPNNAIIDSIWTGDFKYMTRKNRYKEAYNWDIIGYEYRHYYVYIIAWKPAEQAQAENQ